MKPIQVLMLSGLLCFAGTAAAASSDQVPQEGVLPILVQVDSHGEVTSVEPAFELTPQLTRLLHQTLDKMITQPAHHDGHAVKSQFVINLALQVTPHENGDYDVKFAYVSTKPVPSGSWYWVYPAGLHGQPALTLRASYLERQPPRNFREPRWPANSPGVNYPTQMQPNAQAQTVAYRAPAGRGS